MHTWPYLLTLAWSRSHWAVAGHPTEHLALYRFPALLPALLTHKRLSHARSVTVGVHSDTQSIMMAATLLLSCLTLALHWSPELVTLSQRQMDPDRTIGMGKERGRSSWKMPHRECQTARSPASPISGSEEEGEAGAWPRWGHLVLPSLQGYKVLCSKTQKGLYGLLTVSLGEEYSCPSPTPMVQRSRSSRGHKDTEPGQERLYKGQGAGRHVLSLWPDSHSCIGWQPSFTWNPGAPEGRTEARLDPPFPPSFPRAADKGTGLTVADSRRL